MPVCLSWFMLTRGAALLVSVTSGTQERIAEVEELLQQKQAYANNLRSTTVATARTNQATEQQIEDLISAIREGDFSRVSELQELQSQRDAALAQQSKAEAKAAADDDAQRAAIASLEEELSMQREMQATAEAEVHEISALCADRRQTLLML